MSLDYWGLVTRSLKNAWRYKFLWLFGFFAAGMEGSGDIFHVIKDDKSWNSNIPFDINPLIILWIIAAAMLLFLVFFILATISESAMIYGIRRKELNQQVTFADCWSMGIDKFLRVLVILILEIIAIVMSVILMAMFVVPGFIAHVALGLLLIIGAVPLFIAIIFVCEGVAAWALRFTVIEDRSWNDAISDGWNMLRHNLGKTFGVALSSILTQIVVGLGILLPLILLAIPFALFGYMVSLWGALIPGIALFLIIMILVSAFFGVFQSSIWTLAFMKIRGDTGDAAGDQALTPSEDQPPPAPDYSV